MKTYLNTGVSTIPDGINGEGIEYSNFKWALTETRYIEEANKVFILVKIWITTPTRAIAREFEFDCPEGWELADRHDTVLSHECFVGSTLIIEE